MIIDKSLPALRCIAGAAVFCLAGLAAHAENDLSTDEIRARLTSDAALAAIAESYPRPDAVADIVDAYYLRLFRDDMVVEHLRETLAPSLIEGVTSSDIHDYLLSAFTLVETLNTLSSEGARNLPLPKLQTMIGGIVHVMEDMSEEQCALVGRNAVPPEQELEWFRDGLVTMPPDDLERYLEAETESILLPLDPTRESRVLSPAELETAQQTMFAEMNALLAQGSSFGADWQSYEQLTGCAQFTMVATHMLALDEDVQDLILRFLVAGSGP